MVFCKHSGGLSDGTKLAYLGKESKNSTIDSLDSLFVSGFWLWLITSLFWMSLPTKIALGNVVGADKQFEFPANFCCASVWCCCKAFPPKMAQNMLFASEKIET